MERGSAAAAAAAAAASTAASAAAAAAQAVNQAAASAATSHALVQRDLGKMEGQIGAMKERIGALVDESNKTTQALTEINLTLSEAKGGWKMFLMVGGFSAAIGGLIAKFIPFLMNRG